MSVFFSMRLTPDSPSPDMFMPNLTSERTLLPMRISIRIARPRSFAWMKIVAVIWRLRARLAARPRAAAWIWTSAPKEASSIVDGPTSADGGTSNEVFLGSIIDRMRELPVYDAYLNAKGGRRRCRVFVVERVPQESIDRQ